MLEYFFLISTTMVYVCILIAALFGHVLCQPAMFSENVFKPSAFGPELVETVVEMIARTCLLDNEIFLRRIAHVETDDGTDTQTYRTGYNGGIWNVDQQMFQATKNNTSLNRAYDVVKRELGIDWSNVTWSELRQPIKSGLAAAFLILANHIRVIPENKEVQAFLWSTLNPSRNKAFNFVRKEYQRNIECGKDKQLDLVVVLDFQHLTPYDMVELHTFLRAFFGKFSLELNATRVGIVTKRQMRPVASWYLNSQSGPGFTVLNTIKALNYENGGPTTVSDALLLTREEMFNVSHGARVGSSKVALVITDGITQPDTARAEAKKLEASGVHVMVVKVTSTLHNPDVEHMVTPPICANVRTVQSFHNLTTIVERLTRDVCKVPAVLMVGNTSFPCSQNMDARLPESSKGLSVRVTPSSGSITLFGAKMYQHPDDISYDVRLQSQTSNASVLYVRGTDPMYIGIKGQNSTCTGTYTVEIKTTDSFPRTEGVCIVAGTVRKCTDLEMDLITHDVVLVRATDIPFLCDPNNHSLEYFPHPTDPEKYIMCDRDDNPFIGLCPVSTTSTSGTTCKPFTTGCKYTNPCTKEAILTGHTFHIDPCGKEDNYVTCTGFGIAEISTCPPSRVWNEDTNHCVFKYVHDPIRNKYDSTIDNPCIHAHEDHVYFPYPKIQNKYIFCDRFGNAIASMCRGGVWNEQMMACTPTSSLVG